MTNEQLIRNLKNVYERMDRSLIVIEACLETFEMAARHRHESLRDAIDDMKHVVHDVFLLKDSIANKQDLEASVVTDPWVASGA